MKPPPQLKIEGLLPNATAGGRTEPANSAPHVAPINPTAPVNPPTVPTNMQPVPGSILPQIAPVNPFAYPQAQYPMSGYTGFPGFPPPFTPRTVQARLFGLDSAAPADFDDNPGIYPRISDWLNDLDQGPRGEDGQNFVQYANVLERNGYCRIFQIADEAKGQSGAHDLVGLCEGMTLGIAKLLIKYAKIDCDAIQKREAYFRKGARLPAPDFYH